MTRAANWITGFPTLFAILLGAAFLWAQGRGSSSIAGIEAETLRLIGGSSDFSSLAAQGALAVALNALAKLLLDGFGLPSTLLLSAGLGALLIGRFAELLGRAGHDTAAVGAAALIAAINPLTLHTIASGPAAVLLACGCVWLASCLMRLRERGELRDIIGCGLALAFLPLAHPAGFAVTAAALPALALCAPPRLLDRSVTGTYIALTFPAAFLLLSYHVLGWVLDGHAGQDNAIRADRIRLIEPLAGGDMPGLFADGWIGAVLMLPVCAVAAIALQRSPKAGVFLALVAIPALAASFIVLGGWERQVWAALAPFAAMSLAVVLMLARAGLHPAGAVAALLLCALGGWAMTAHWHRIDNGRDNGRHHAGFANGRVPGAGNPPPATAIGIARAFVLDSSHRHTDQQNRQQAR